MEIKQAIGCLLERQSLSTADMSSVMQQIMTGGCDDAQIGAFLVALRMKGETLDEIEGAVRVMRELATGVAISHQHAVDIVGTGGDGANLFNVSTASALVVAAAGGHVAKHGNRGVSSSSGSADLLETAGVNLNLNADQVARCVSELGVGFMFAPQHHSAMKHAIGARKSLGQRTIFNILGPMTNPAGVQKQLIGVFDQALCRPMVEVLHRLGAQHIMVVHAADGLDEISLATTTHVCELKDGVISEYEIAPVDLGLKRQDIGDLSVASSQQSLDLIKDALGQRQTAAAEKAADMLALNAGAAIYVSDLASTLKQGVEMAEDAIYSGLALEKLNELVSYTALIAADS